MDPKTIQDIGVILYGVALMGGSIYYLTGSDEAGNKRAPKRENPPANQRVSDDLESGVR